MAECKHAATPLSSCSINTTHQGFQKRYITLFYLKELKSYQQKCKWKVRFTVESHNSGQVGRPEIVPYCGIFPYFASSLFTNGHFGHSGFVPYFASFPYFAVPYCERLLYVLDYSALQIKPTFLHFPL